MKLKASERRLLTVFLSLFAVIVGVFGTSFLVRHFGGAAGEVRDLVARRDSLVKMLGESKLWGERSRWIEERIPTFPAREDASTHLLDSVSQKAESTGVSILKKQLLTDPNAPTNQPPGLRGSPELDGGRPVYFDRVAVILELEGSEQKVLQWLHGIQRPGSFLGVTHLGFTPAKDRVRCTAQVSLWFREFAPPNLAKSP